MEQTPQQIVHNKLQAADRKLAEHIQSRQRLTAEYEEALRGHEAKEHDLLIERNAIREVWAAVSNGSGADEAGAIEEQPPREPTQKKDAVARKINWKSETLEAAKALLQGGRREDYFRLMGVENTKTNVDSFRASMSRHRSGTKLIWGDGEGFYILAAYRDAALSGQTNNG